MELDSRKYPGISYQEGKEIFLGPGERGLPFYFDVSEDLAGNREAMSAAAAALDEVEALAEMARAHLKSLLAGGDSEGRRAVAYFMEFHRDELDPQVARELFSVEAPSALAFEQMVDRLRINRFGSLADSQLGQQVFILDLNFDPEVTDELMAVYFDLDRRIVAVAHES